MPAEQVTAAPFIKNAQARLEANRQQEALRELHAFFARSSRASFEWSPVIDEYVALHSQLCVQLRDDKCAWEALSKFRTKFQQQHMLDKYPQVVGTYMKAAYSALDAARQKASHHAAPSSIGSAVRALYGASLERIADDRALEQAFSLFHIIITKCLKAISMDGTLEKYYQMAIQRAFTAYSEAGRVREFMSLCSMLRGHTEILTKVTQQSDTRLQDHKMLILSDKYFADNVRAMMQTKHVQIMAAAKLGNWENVYNVIEEHRALLTEFRRAGKAKMIPMQAQVQFQRDLKEICFQSKQFAFGANEAIRSALLSRLDSDATADDRQRAATEAVLAVLCVPPASRRATVSIAHDSEKEKRIQLARAFNVPTPPTRDSLTTDLQRHGLLEQADPLARALFAGLNDPQSVHICQVAAPLLQQLVANDTSLERFVKAIQECAINALLGVVSTCFSQISIKHFMELVAFLPESEFASRVEPIVVAVAANVNSAISVAIDDASNSIRFSSTASLGNRAVGIESEFSQRLSAAVHGCFNRAQSTSQPPVSKLADLRARVEEERLRIATRARLCELRIEKQQEREEMAKAREEQRKAEELQRRQQRENERNEKRRELEIRKVERQVGVQEQVERRKFVMKHVTQKHKGFAPPSDVAGLPQEDFAEALTAKLLEFRRKEEMMKESDARSMDYYERACREEEIPRRQQHEAELAAANARNFEERRENRRRQHREDWEKAIENKRRLAKFEAHRAKYESDLEAAIRRVTKPSKGDDQEKALEAFRREREQTAADARAEEAEPAKPEPKEPAKAGKWVPPSRR